MTSQQSNQERARVALVSGAGSGMGKAAAFEFTKAGCK